MGFCVPEPDEEEGAEVEEGVAMDARVVIGLVVVCSYLLGIGMALTDCDAVVFACVSEGREGG